MATVLSIAGMVALVWGFKRAAKAGLADSAVLVALVLAAVALTLFVVRCLNREEPLLRVRLFAVPCFTAGVLAALFTMLAMGATLLLVTQWLQLVQGMSPLQSGVGLLPMAIASVVFSPLAPVLAQWIGARSVLAGGLALSGVGFGILALAPEPLTYAPVALAQVLLGAGMGALAIASAIVMSGTAPEHAGSAAAIEETSYELASVLGVAILGSAAAALYRSGLPASDLAGAGLSPAGVAAARESLGGALHVLAGPGSGGRGGRCPGPGGFHAWPDGCGRCWGRAADVRSGCGVRAHALRVGRDQGALTCRPGRSCPVVAGAVRGGGAPRPLLCAGFQRPGARWVCRVIH